MITFWSTELLSEKAKTEEGKNMCQLSRRYLIVEEEELPHQRIHAGFTISRKHMFHVFSFIRFIHGRLQKKNIGRIDTGLRA